MKSKPLIFGGALDALANDTNPAIRQICALAKRQTERTEFQRAIVRNLKNPAAMLKALKPKPGTTSAKNLEKLAKALSNKPPTRAELNAARLNAIYRKPSL